MITEAMKAHKITSPAGMTLDNLVYNRHGEVHAFRSMDFHAWDHPQMGGDYGIYAIPLDEDWLRRCGFKRQDGHRKYFKTRPWSIVGRITIHWQSDEGYAVYDGSGMRHLRFLHELQNLFFAVDGQELEIKLETKQ